MEKATVEVETRPASPIDHSQPHLSYSQLNLYLSCPLKYYFRYVERIESPMESNLLLGRMVHKGAERFHRDCIETHVLKPHYREIFEDSMTESLEQYEMEWGEGETPELIVEQAVKLMGVYEKEAKPGNVLDVESGFLLDLGCGVPPLLGYIDLLELDDEGRMTVCDVKTSARRYSQGQADLSLQLSLYAMAVAEHYGVRADEVRLRFDVLVKNKKPMLQQVWTERTEKQADWARAVVYEVYEAIDNGNFYPCPSVMNCSKCPYKTECSNWWR